MLNSKETTGADTSKGGLIGKIRAAMIKLGEKPLLLAFLLNLAAFLIRILIFEVKYEVSDDYITDAVLSGAFGSGYDPNLLFGNTLLGYLLVFLYKLIPAVSFYFVLLIALGFISVTAVLYLLFKRKVNVTTVCMALLFLSFFTDDLYVLVQFTKSATAAGIAGGLLILHGLWEAKEKRVKYIALGTILAIFGIMVRFDVIFIFAAFLVVAFIAHIFSFLKESGKKADKKAAAGIGARFLICVAIIGLFFGLNIIGTRLSNLDDGHRKFNEFHVVRYNLTDIGRPDYKQVKDEYEKMGLDYTDYAMLETWNFVDREVYSDELLRDITALNNRVLAEENHSAANIISSLVENKTFSCPASLIMFALIIFAFALGKKKIYPPVLALSAVTLIAAFVYMGRTVYRIEWSVFYCAASCVLASFSFNEEGFLYKQKKCVGGKDMHIISFFAVILVTMLMLFNSARVLTSFVFKDMSDHDYIESFEGIMGASSLYMPEKAGFPTSSRKPTPNIIEYMENDSEHFYYVDFATGIQELYFNYDPWIRPDEGLFRDGYAYFGGCTMHHPAERDALMANGADPDSPYKSLANDNILLVDTWGAEIKLDYFRRYYNPDAEMEVAGEIDGYQIWNIYVPEA